MTLSDDHDMVNFSRTHIIRMNRVDIEHVPTSIPDDERLRTVSMNAWTLRSWRIDSIIDSGICSRLPQQLVSGAGSRLSRLHRMRRMCTTDRVNQEK
jgi:hypothetical protein